MFDLFEDWMFQRDKKEEKPDESLLNRRFENASGTPMPHLPELKGRESFNAVWISPCEKRKKWLIIPQSRTHLENHPSTTIELAPHG
jgi:hypothetical protein